MFTKILVKVRLPKNLCQLADKLLGPCIARLGICIHVLQVLGVVDEQDGGALSDEAPHLIAASKRVMEPQSGREGCPTANSEVLDFLF